MDLRDIFMALSSKDRTAIAADATPGVGARATPWSDHGHRGRLAAGFGVRLRRVGDPRPGEALAGRSNSRGVIACMSVAWRRPHSAWR
jgi:hypothetical protein